MRKDHQKVFARSKSEIMSTRKRKQKIGVLKGISRNSSCEKMDCNFNISFCYGKNTPFFEKYNIDIKIMFSFRDYY